MAIARKCDRCGRLYEDYDDIECNGMLINQIVIGQMNGGVPYDLCRKCSFDLARWITNPELIPQEKTEFKVEIKRSEDPITSRITQIKEETNNGN